MCRIKNKKIAAIILIAAIIVINIFVIFPAVTVIVYESVFGKRYETEPWLKPSAQDYEALTVERSDFISGGENLAGYKYSKENQEVKGVVIIAHGLGCGGHDTFMSYIDLFTSNGYLVFAYDAIGNGNSSGVVEGLPSGVISLDGAINHVKSLREYEHLPISLFGHSFGAYSVANALALHPDIKSAVIIAGFNESEDLLAYQGENAVGKGALLLMPYLELYERIKFGRKFTDLTAIDGFLSTDARIMITHSKDDASVPVKYGYDKFYDALSNSERFEFVLYEDKGHEDLLYSDEALKYREELLSEYERYLSESQKSDSPSIKEEFMKNNLDKEKYFSQNESLASKILEMLDTASLE